MNAVHALVFVVLGGVFLYATIFFGLVGTQQTTSQLLLFLVLTLLGALLFLYGLLAYSGTSVTLDLLEHGYRDFKAFFVSPIFYIVLGCLFLWTAFAEADKAHSALIFLVAILGVAIVLYGTGTQAAGTASVDGQSPDLVKANIKANIVIAGGAGALAAFFGYGVLQYPDVIPKVFKRTLDFGILELYVDGAAKLDQYEVRAYLPGSRPLHAWRSDSSLQVIVPILNPDSDAEVTISLLPGLDYTLTSDRHDQKKSVSPQKHTLSWKKTVLQYGFNNEIVRVQREAFPEGTFVAREIVPSVRPDNALTPLKQLTDDQKEKLEKLPTLMITPN